MLRDSKNDRSRAHTRVCAHEEKKEKKRSQLSLSFSSECV